MGKTTLKEYTCRGFMIILLFILITTGYLFYFNSILRNHFVEEYV